MSFQAMAWAMTQTPDDAESKLLLLCLANYANQDNQCWPSISRLSADTLLSERTIQYKLQELLGGVFIKIELRKRDDGGNTSNLYTVCCNSFAQSPLRSGCVPPPQGVHPNEPISEPEESTPTPSKGKKEWNPTDLQKRIAAIIGRRPATRWAADEIKAFRAIDFEEPDILAMERYYKMRIPEDKDFRRRDLLRVLRHWNGELDKARRFKEPNVL